MPHTQCYMFRIKKKQMEQKKKKIHAFGGWMADCLYYFILSAVVLGLLLDSVSKYYLLLSLVSACTIYSLVLFCDARKWILHFSLNLSFCMHTQNSEQFRIYGNAFVSCSILLFRSTWPQSFVLCSHIFQSRLKRREVQKMNFKMYFQSYNHQLIIKLSDTYASYKSKYGSMKSTEHQTISSSLTVIHRTIFLTRFMCTINDYYYYYYTRFH